MIKKIEKHINSLFPTPVKESYIFDIKEELLSNLIDKYNDLVASGKSEDEAYALVISGIGDIDNLLKDISKSPQYQPLEIAKNKEKRGILFSIGIALYIISIIPLFLFERLGNLNLGIIIAITICAIATAFIIYGNMISKSNYIKRSNSFVEEYKEKVTVNSNRRKLLGAISAALWPLVVVVYFIISFTTKWWHITWVTFIIGTLIQLLIVYCFASSRVKRGLWHGLLWVSCLITYVIISFTLKAWVWSWLIFLLTAALEQIIRLFLLLKKEDGLSETKIY